MTFGHFKPIILFPIGLINQLSTSEVEAILLHELAHIKRHDFLVNVFQNTVEIILFYHPMIWWLNRTIRNIREEACDDLAVNIQNNRQVYAETLLLIQKHSLTSKNHLIMNATGQKGQLTERVHRLFKQPSSTKNRSFSMPLVFVFLIIGGFSLLAFQTIRNQPTVSIAADKMNILYLGVENPITVAVEQTQNSNVKISSEDMTITPLGNGKYNVLPKKEGKVIIKVETDEMKRDMEFRVKLLPDPLPKALNVKSEIEKNGSGTLTVDEMKAMAGIGVTKNKEFNTECQVVYYEFTRVPKGKDVTTEVSKVSLFANHPRIPNHITQTKSGDVYYVDKITVLCPGEEKTRKLPSLIFKIK
jgi:hypothetical protein